MPAVAIDVTPTEPSLCFPIRHVASPVAPQTPRLLCSAPLLAPFGRTTRSSFLSICAFPLVTAVLPVAFLDSGSSTTPDQTILWTACLYPPVADTDTDMTVMDMESSSRNRYGLLLRQASGNSLLNPNISLGTCYLGPNQPAAANFIPCGNYAYDTYSCCQAGDNCLGSNACYNYSESSSQAPWLICLLTSYSRGRHHIYRWLHRSFLLVKQVPQQGQLSQSTVGWPGPVQRSSRNMDRL